MIGDCAEQREAIDERRPIEAVWYTGRMMGEALAQTLTGKPTQYKPGHWFNSAKFWTSNTKLTDGFLQNNWNMKFNFIGNIKTVKKQFESRSIKKVDSFINTTFGIRMRHEFLTKYLLRKNSRLCHPAFGRSQFRSRVIY
jgi:hypothetical protein